jgi:L-amino acid N-acyltransferase YncA
MTIRPAVVEDARDIATIHIRSWQAAYRGLVADTFLDNLDINTRTKRWESTLTDEKYQTLVYENDSGQTVGFATCEPHEEADLGSDTVELMMLYLRPEVQGRGLGRLLCEATIDRVRKQGFKKLILWTLSRNEPARGFYEHMGFIADGKTGKYLIGGVEHDTTRYVIML